MKNYTESELRRLTDNSLFKLSEKLSIYSPIYFIEVGTKMLVRDRNQKEELIKEILNKQEKMKKNNPWISGSFYLVVAVVIIASLGVLSNIVYWSVFPIIIVAGILVIALVGILQLKNDEKISDKSFTSLIKETYKRLPLIGKHKK